MKPTIKRKPTPPGEFLRKDFLEPMGMTQKELADYIGCDIKVINRIVNEQSRVTAEIAIKLAAAFGMTPDFWLNAQTALDLYYAARAAKKLPRPHPKLKCAS